VETTTNPDTGDPTAIELRRFFLTFGPDHIGGCPDPRVDPAGWVEVRARDMEEARRLVVSRFGLSWAFCYVEAEFTDNVHGWFPRGCLFVLEAE